MSDDNFLADYQIVKRQSWRLCDRDTGVKLSTTSSHFCLVSPNLRSCDIILHYLCHFSDFSLAFIGVPLNEAHRNKTFTSFIDTYKTLKWFGHVSRSSGLAKAILQGAVQGGRRRGRQMKRWENNIAEWTGLKFCHAVREAKNK